MGIEQLLGLVIYIVIIALIFWAIMWFVGYVGVPEPFNKIIKVIIGIVALIIVVSLLLGLLGGAPSFHLAPFHK